MAHIQQDRDRAQAAHDAADAQRVGNRLAQAIFFGDFKVDDGARFVAAHLEHTDRVVRAIQRRPPISGHFDLGVGPQCFGGFMRHNRRGAQPFFVDVVQAQGDILLVGKAENVAHQIFGEDCAACADKGDFGHVDCLPFLYTFVALKQYKN